MAPIIQFTQNAITPGPAVAMIGVPALVVTVDDVSVDVVVSRTFELMDVPLDAATLPGIFGGPGMATTATFTPDVNPNNFGCYRVRVSTISASGVIAYTILNFATQTAQGWILPSFRSKASELNFAGNVEGWEELLNRIFKWLSLNWGAFAAAIDIQEDLAVGEAINVGDPVVQSAVADRIIRADASDPTKTGVIGIATTAQAVIGATATIVYCGKAINVLTGATPGAAQYLAAGGGITEVVPTTGVKLGYASNAADLVVNVTNLSGSSDIVQKDVAVNEAITAGDPVYQSAVNNRVAKGNANSSAKSGIIGIARTTQAVIGSNTTVVYAGICVGILVGATAGAEYWLAVGGGLTATPPVAAGSRMISCGFAVNATDLDVRIVDYLTLPS